MIAAADILVALGWTSPTPPNPHAGKTPEQIIAEIRSMLATMPDLPFDPATARIDLPAHMGGPSMSPPIRRR